jgi:hypothetical protein
MHLTGCSRYGWNSELSGSPVAVAVLYLVLSKQLTPPAVVSCSIPSASVGLCRIWSLFILVALCAG